MTFADLRAGGFYFKSLAGEDAILGAPDRSGTIKPTPLFDQLLEPAGDLKPKHIGIDTSADVFAGNEIDRTQVRQFIGLLRRLAIAANGSVVLLSHPSLTGINSGTAPGEAARAGQAGGCRGPWQSRCGICRAVFQGPSLGTVVSRQQCSIPQSLPIVLRGDFLGQQCQDSLSFRFVLWCF